MNTKIFYFFSSASSCFWDVSSGLEDEHKPKIEDFGKTVHDLQGSPMNNFKSIVNETLNVPVSFNIESAPKFVPYKNVHISNKIA